MGKIQKHRTLGNDNNERERNHKSPVSTKRKVDYLTKKKKFKWFVYRAHFRDTISNQSAGSSQIEKKEY